MAHEVIQANRGGEAARLARAERHSPIESLLKGLGRVLGGGLTLVLVVLGSLLLVFTVPSAAMIWGAIVVAVAIAIAALIYRPFAVGVSALFSAGAIVVLISQLAVSTPPIGGANGRPVSGSVAEMRKVNLGGSEQWIVIRGQSVKNPVLLYLAGGPGGTETGWFRKFNGQLENNFVVVDWEQPGAGKSSAVAWDARGLTPQRYVADGLQLTNYLRQRFHQDKIYLVGHSWGTFLGIWMVQQHPEMFYAYVGVAQMVNPKLTDRLGYQDVINRAQRDGNTALVQKLKADGPPPYYGPSLFLTYADYLTAQNDYMVAEEEKAGGAPYLGNPIDDIASPEYGLADKIGSIGVVNPLTFTMVYPQLQSVDFTTQASKLGVPAYFVQGRHDLNNWAPMVDRYYQVLQAPQKELIWFENAGHNTLYEDPARFNYLMVNRVLPGTLPEGTAR